MNVPSEVMKLYRFHPVTGADANIFDTVGWTDEQKEELAAMVRAGAKFYWQKDDHPDQGISIEGYCKVERQNILFVLTVTGTNYLFVEQPVLRPSDLAP